MKARKTNTDQITLGEGWRQFAYAQTDIELLGVIRRGIEIGALARANDGAFLQVNGDMRQPLNSSRIQALLRTARASNRPATVTSQPTSEQRAAVKVTVRPKRRVLVRD